MLADLRRHGIRDPKILRVMADVPRHCFFPPAFLTRHAYADHPHPIGHGQTISQPFIVAYMTQLLDIQSHHRVLEIGSGSGYQTAVLAQLARHVYSLERIEWLVQHARAVIASLNLDNVSIRLADGFDGWAEEAPFDRIMVTCAPPELPDQLLGQLAEGGRFVAPIGTGVQQLQIVTRENDRFHRVGDEYVRFIPMLHGTE